MHFGGRTRGQGTDRLLLVSAPADQVVAAAIEDTAKFIASGGDCMEEQVKKDNRDNPAFW